MTDNEIFNKQLIDRVLVTGASGFIGQHLVPLLIEAGHTCRIIYHSIGQNLSSWNEDNIDIVLFDLDDNKKSIEEHFISSPELEQELSDKGKQDLLDSINQILQKKVGFRIIYKIN